MKDDDEKARLEDEPDKDSTEGDETPEDAGLEPSGVCASCGMGNEDNAKFCNQCGGSMAAPPLDDDKDPPSSKPGAAAVMAPKRVSAEGTVAAIIGATSESVPAVKARALDMRHIVDTAAAVFATTVPGEIVGHLLGLPERLASGDRAIRDHAKAKAEGEKKGRWDLARRLNALGLAGRPRSSIFVDRVSQEGKRVAVGLQPEYARMDLDVLRGLVSSLERSAPKARRDPFEASRERAENVAKQADPHKPPATDAAADVVVGWAKKQSAFANMRKQLPVSFSDEQIGRQLAATMRGAK